MQLEKEQEAVVRKGHSIWDEFRSLVLDLGQSSHARALSSTPTVCFGGIDYLLDLYWSPRRYRPARKSPDDRG